MALSVRSAILTRPTLGAPRRALCPRGWRAVFEVPFQSSFRACLYVLPQGGLGCFQLRASTSTDFLRIRLIRCARWASKGSCLARPFTIFRSQARTGPCGFRFHPSREQRSDMGIAPPFLLCALCEHRGSTALVPPTFLGNRTHSVAVRPNIPGLGWIGRRDGLVRGTERFRSHASGRRGRESSQFLRG